jgi:hypothetical protein
LKNLAIPCLLLLAACSKSIDQQHPPTINDEKETCSFGLTEFNMAKRPAINMEMSKGKPGSGSGAAVLVPLVAEAAQQQQQMLSCLILMESM